MIRRLASVTIPFVRYFLLFLSLFFWVGLSHAEESSKAKPSPDSCDQSRVDITYLQGGIADLKRSIISQEIKVQTEDEKLSELTDIFLEDQFGVTPPHLKMWTKSILEDARRDPNIYLNIDVKNGKAVLQLHHDLQVERQALQRQVHKDLLQQLTQKEKSFR